MAQHIPQTCPYLRSAASSLQEMDICQRCEKSVYLAEKAGTTVRDAVFHKQCFKCAECDQYLTPKTFNTNEVDGGDRNVYCATHKPRKRGSAYGFGALGIRDAMLAQNLMKGRKLFFAKDQYMSYVVSDVIQ